MDLSKPLLQIDDLDFEALNAVWRGADVRDVGQLLRSHLVVEHFMTLHLLERNPHLADFDEARLTFNQKLTLLGTTGPMSLLHSGIRRLNKLRNRVAHQLSYAVTVQDLAPLFQPGKYFRDFLDTWCQVKQLASPSPIETIEAFANYATMWLHTGTRMNQKFKELEKELDAEDRRVEQEFARIDGVKSALAAWKESLEEGDDEPDEAR